jgi:hypothetical protein
VTLPARCTPRYRSWRQAPSQMPLPRGHLACTTVAPRVVSHVVTVRSEMRRCPFGCVTHFCQRHTAQIAGVRTAHSRVVFEPIVPGLVPCQHATMNRVSMFCRRSTYKVSCAHPEVSPAQIDDHSLFTMSRDDGLCSGYLTQAHYSKPFPHVLPSVSVPKLVITTCHMSRIA